MTIENPLDIVAVLQWIAGIGGAYVVGQLVSYLAENWVWWHTAPRWVKFFGPMILSVLLSVGATFALQQTEILAIISPYWTLIVGAILTYFGTQKAYMQAKVTGYGNSARLAALRLEAGGDGAPGSGSYNSGEIG